MFDSESDLASERTEAAIFYYPWFGTPTRDGAYEHWEQNGQTPPVHVSSSYFPTRGAYSSSDPAVLAAQMDEIAGAGIGRLIVSWWGRGSAEDARLPLVLAAATKVGLAVDVHVEPYVGRTVASVEADIEQLRRRGIRDFYIWASTRLPDEEWAGMNVRLARLPVRTFANTNLAGRASRGGFAGIYTYDVLLFDGPLFRRLCAQAHKLELVCAPSVGPGYDARRATGDARLKERRQGATYDRMWRAALRAGADIVTITSYNEWHEGTQIEPARGRAGYESYEGAYGLTGPGAERAYLERTAWWTSRAGQEVARR
jgi:glycoprotein endo-alpha-1,2-mannosidase